MITKTITHEVTFSASQHEVYEALIDPEKQSSLTGAPAEIERKPGGGFVQYNGGHGGALIECKREYVERDVRTKRNLAAIFLAALCLAVLAGVAGAEETVKGKVKTVDLETNTVVVTTYQGQNVTITISQDDTWTLKKLRKKLIKVGDDVTVKYVNKDGKHVATFFRILAEC